MSDDLEFSTLGLDNLLKAMKGQMKQARVGILGSAQTHKNEKLAEKGQTLRGNASGMGSKINAARPPKPSKITTITNATLGAIHEFGTTKMPMRSFLRMPISSQLQSRLENASAFDREAVKQVIKEKSFAHWLSKIATIAEDIVRDAFDTGGFGKWPKWKTKGYENNTGQLLVDTQQLRNSITSEVK